MPLDTKNAFIFVALDGLDGTVGGSGTDTQQRTSITYGLMVERVDVELFFLLIYIK